uniref:Protein phosphatase n=1 Tax=Solanum lycopersicum TaxID=4081 RepID=A0A3Q7HF99_SOLLC
MDEMDVDKDLSFRRESTNNVLSFPNGNFRMKMAAGSFYIPRSDKAPLGEDAHFICGEEETIGVADGVGSWARKGIDPGEYSRQLVRNAELSIQKQKDQRNKIDPMEVLNEAYLNTKCQGSSTACILTLSCDTIHAANVGDSRFVVIRDGVIVYKSEIQQRGFNYPFQLGNGVELDDPSVAQEINATVRIGDVIVMATDGLFDNVRNHELEKLVHDGVGDLHKLETFSKMLAQKIAEYALQKSESKTVYTPYAEECSKAQIYRPGGKRDDITVIVAQILPR